jgi:membrane-associated protease RseP (regulator of RpoE activity)
MHRALKFCAITTLMMSMAAPWSMAKGMPGDPSNGAYLGVMVDKVSPEAASALHLSGGTLISTVDQDGPACQAGLKPGDIVSAYNGKPVTDPDQFASLIHSTPAGSTVTMTVWRNAKSQEMKVKLGSWSRMSAVVPPPTVPLNPVGTMPLAPPVPAMPDIDIRTYTPMVARSGIVVEPMSSQLAEFFGAPANKGVLVRTVEKGGPGASAGLKAGDVILRVNNETIHDMADWKRALKAQSGKVSLQIIRDKHEQTLQMVVPASTSKLEGPDWEQFGKDMQVMADEMKAMQPEFEQNAREWAQMAKLDQKQVDEIRHQAEKAARSITPEIQKQAAEWSKQAAQMQVQSEELRKQVEKMKPEWERQAREMAESMKPSAKELSDMTREIQKSMKEWQPEFQKQMKEFQKEWKQQSPEFQKQMEKLQKQMQEWQQNSQESFPKQM